MAEYIEREALIKRLEASPLIKNYLIMRGSQNLINGIFDLIKRHPTADVVEVVYAEWIKAGFGISERVVCSHCRSHHGSYLKPPFCSQCGAKMDGERR